MRNSFARLALLVSAAFVSLNLIACGEDWTVGPSDYDGGYSESFYKQFHYYYGEACRYDSFEQPYDCSDPYALGASYSVSLSVTYDGYATLCVENECSYYDPGEYVSDYDGGYRYYDFRDGDERFVIYADGRELIYIDYDKREATYLYYDYPYESYYAY